ncbi:hypothetical protein DEU56DRAFT_795032 [Suillus clintonianus]|uniref:uncharacterized protein n=1 Tax=Suillus clintonianus TaxID=1904413 RepID=UPI001B877364|nr:uncharacterized protein DEU56DRAFT_795032 [Suillus clintonianus]KAG2141842.1 hypothetical protein DEU56DRAFT_795032 [Suillus clintonianus]
MVTYSAFFSSGLLAPYHPRATTPAPLSSPMPSSPMQPVDRDLSVTPTPTGNSNSVAAVPTANAERPRMRRRRSSMNIAASPMALIKSPTRNAGSALQRTGAMSPTRSRAGSIAENASESNSLFGRLRSGSLNAGAPLRLRRAVKRTIPLAPPPTAPLPALPPPSPSAKYTRTLAPPALIIPVPRQPLMNYFVSTPGLLSPDSVMQFTSNMSPGISSSPAHTCYFGSTIDEEMKEN